MFILQYRIRGTTSYTLLILINQYREAIDFFLLVKTYRTILQLARA